MVGVAWYHQPADRPTTPFFPAKPGGGARPLNKFLLQWSQVFAAAPDLVKSPRSCDADLLLKVCVFQTTNQQQQQQQQQQQLYRE